jgi:hypothetical protein
MYFPRFVLCEGDPMVAVPIKQGRGILLLAGHKDDLKTFLKIDLRPPRTITGGFEARNVEQHG